MKKRVIHLLLVAAATLFALPAFAQSYLEDPKWGDTPEDRTENAMTFNLLRDVYDNKDYVSAVPYLQQMLEHAPRASANIYVYGNNIYKNKAARATSVADKNMYIDSLMLLYDLRAEHFGDDPTRGRGYILTLKAIDYLDYRPTDRDGVRRYFSEAIAANGNDVESDLVNVYFNELTEDYKDDLLEADEYMAQYDRLESILKSPQHINNSDALRTLEALFVSSGAANCENIERLFGDRINQNPGDAELVTKVVGLLSRGNCRGDFFLKVAELYYQNDPSSNTALVLAAGYEDKGDFDKALEYLLAAFNQESDPELKTNLAVRIAGTELSKGNASAAANYARQAIQINPESGLGYYILAQAYATGANNCSGFDRSSVYWLVYDTLVTAKRLLGSDESQVGNIDQQMANYRASFPSSEECFFRGLDDGDGYTINCGWISGRTTVRKGR